jgi:hypothetical protein
MQARRHSIPNSNNRNNPIINPITNTRTIEYTRCPRTDEHENSLDTNPNKNCTYHNTDSDEETSLACLFANQL